jgi:uncharacterized protein YabN with tetrapyrrole methylase and pyrophosphatase domain
LKEEGKLERGSLTVVGTGIRLAGQVTRDAVVAMERAEKLLYLVAEPATEVWLKKRNPSAESLYGFYSLDMPRSWSYERMVEHILSFVRQGLQVCFALYGHPGVFVYPSHEAIRRAQREDFRAYMLPGISAEDCLFADLGVDPGLRGCQSFEATDFLVHTRRFDPTSCLVLWQIGVIGEPGATQRTEQVTQSLEILVEVLLESYGPDHEVVIYEAAQFPVCVPVKERLPLSELPRAAVSMLATLFVPPLQERPASEGMLRRLGMISPG